MDDKKIVYVIATFMLFLMIVLLSRSNNEAEKARKQKVREVQIGKLQFKGRVISSRIYKYAGKNYYMICVKLDSSNVKSFTIYNELNCLKIHNNIATMPAGVLNNTLGVVDYVEMNINNSKQIVYHYKDRARQEFPLELDPRGVQESDMDFCN